MRLEDESYEQLVRDRAVSLEQWPEPASSRFYAALRRGASNIIVSQMGKRDEELAFECATKVLLDLWKFKGRSKFSTWFYRYVRNEVLMRVRKEKFRKEESIEELTELMGKSFDITSLIDFTKQFEQLKLDDGELALIYLLLEGLSYNEIATRLDSTSEGVRKRWQRLRSKLSSALKSLRT